MSLANVDSTYRLKARGLAEKVVQVEMRATADGGQEPNPEQPKAGYIRFRMRQRAGKAETVGARIKFNVGGSARDLERSIDEEMTNIAQDAGAIWVDALYTGETDVLPGSFRVDSDGGGSRTGNLDELAHDKGAGASLLLAAAHMVEAVGRQNVELVRHQGQVQEAHSRMYAEIAQLKEREGYTRLIAQAESRDAMWTEVAPHLAETAKALLLSHGIQDLLGRLGGGPAPDTTEQPADGRARAVWDLEQAATVLEDAVGHFNADVAADEVAQGHLARIQDAARKILAYYQPPPPRPPDERTEGATT